MRALRDDARYHHQDLRILSSATSPNWLDVKFSLKGEETKPVDIIAVLTDDSDRSNVLRGENGGRLLQHVSVARSLTRVATVRGEGEQSVHVQLPSGFQLGEGTAHHLILFAQEQHHGEIVGATTVLL